MWTQILVVTVVLKLTVSRSAAVFTELTHEIGNSMRSPEPGAALGLFGGAIFDGVLLVLPVAGALALIGVGRTISPGGVGGGGEENKTKAARINPEIGRASGRGRG